MGLAQNPTRMQRTFKDLSDDTGKVTDDFSFVDFGLRSPLVWDALLASQRILIVAEAGAGKTYECQKEQESRWQAGEPAFFFELALLDKNSPEELFTPEEADRFEKWKTSQADIALFFLDSFDELKLTRGSFELALKRISRLLNGLLGRAKIVITTRPVPMDFALVQKLLPIPERSEPQPTADAFADIAMNRAKNVKSDPDAPPPWRRVALTHLSTQQIRAMAAGQGVVDVDGLMDDIKRRNAEDFARRPQDLIELCADWRDHKRIRTHRDQVASNVAVKLKPRSDREEKVQLTPDRAYEGVSRLALAALLTRKLTFRHSVESDKGTKEQSALDPALVLTDWDPKEVETLLERPIFGFASYGRVRFHHRSVIEFLASERLKVLIGRGLNVRALRRLIFCISPDNLKLVKPTMKPVAAWLSKTHEVIFNEICENQPEILLEYGDPESLTVHQRKRAISSYVNLYGAGGWRGIRIPSIQTHRFASADLSDELLRLWNSGIANAEVLELMLEIAASVPMGAFEQISHSVLMDSSAQPGERLEALDLLIGLKAKSLDDVVKSILNEPQKWPTRLLRNVIPRLFPQNIDVERLCQILERIEPPQRHGELLGYTWLSSITDGEMPAGYIESFRDQLTQLIAKGIEWRKEYPHLFVEKRHLLQPLAALCLRQVRDGQLSDEVIYSSILALRLQRDDYDRKEISETLRVEINKLPASLRKKSFWTEDALCQSLHPTSNSWKRLCEVAYSGAIRLNEEQDYEWVFESLSDEKEPVEVRAVLVEAALRVVGRGEWKANGQLIREKVADSPELLEIVEKSMTPSEISADMKRMDAEHKRHVEKEKRKNLKDHASWIDFWKAVSENPVVAFSPDKSGHTAWNLWHAMSRSGEESRSSGWNRRFIERHFSKDVADRLRLVLKGTWRGDVPTLRTERPKSEESTFLIRWQLGLAGIAAEAEDPRWAVALSVNEAELACRYAPLESSGFPSWMDSLVLSHPQAVEKILGPQLSNELESPAIVGSYRMALQNICFASAGVAQIFVPRLEEWFVKSGRAVNPDEDIFLVADRLNRVIEVLLNYRPEIFKAQLLKVADEELAKNPGFSGLNSVWLPTLIQLNPGKGVLCLDDMLMNIVPAAKGDGIDVFGSIFGDRHRDAIVDVGSPEFTPAILLKLVRLAYAHVRPTDDIQHENSFTPGRRDHAERGRNAVLSALLESRGPEAWTCKLEMANDPLFAGFRDRAIHIAKEKASEESDSTVLSETQCAALDSYHETAPITREEMFLILADRLDEIEDSLLRDDSPRATWALIGDEKVMRREITRQLKAMANHVYTVDQEGVTADEKETDIRMRSTASELQAVIELKLGDERTGRDLRDTIKDQLVKKYLAPESCRSGCLLVTVKKDRNWEHPDTKELVDIAGLAEMLNQEVEKVSIEMSGMVSIFARILDLRPRLATEVKVKL